MHRALIAIAAALAIPASASATTYCVGNAACEQAGGTHEDTIQDALNAANANGGHDDVSVGAGTFAGNPLSSDIGGVTISGLGPDKTVLSPIVAGPPNYPFVLTLLGPSRVTGLSISLPAIERAQGLSLAEGATADNIAIHGSAVTDQSGAELDGATLVGSEIDMPGTDSVGVHAVGEGARVERDSISAQSSILVNAASGSTTHLHALRLRPFDFGLALYGGDVELTDSVIDARSPDSRGIFVDAYGSAPARVDARHVTISGGGSPGYAGIGVYGAATASLRLRDSIIEGFDIPVQRSTSGTGSAVVALDRVDRWPAHPVDDVPGGGQITDANPLAVDPGFSDLPGADFTLAASSPLVDAGTPGALEAGEPETDLAGAPRIADGNGDCAVQRDVGAYERAAAACAPPPAGPVPSPQPGPSADTTAPRLSGVKLRRRHRGLVVRFRLSEHATVKVKAGKRSTTRVLAAGGRKLRVTKVARGRITVRLIATDAAGNRATIVRRIR